MEKIGEIMTNNIPFEFVKGTEDEYAVLAAKVGAVPFAKQLVMSDGVKIGSRSNRFVYVLPVAYKVATGKYPKGYHGDTGE